MMTIVVADVKYLNMMIIVVDEGTFRNMIVWLEDTKIRQYKIEERVALRAVNSDTWPATLIKVR